MLQQRIISAILIVLSFQSCAYSQKAPPDCGENLDSPHKLFVFVGERLSVKTVDAHDWTNEARYVATYKIVERVCGSFPADTIIFDVIQISYDSGFARNKYLLLALTKDTVEGAQFELWGGLWHDVFKTRDGSWAGSYDASNNTTYDGEPILAPHKIRFSTNAFYDITGMTREETDLTYPAPYYSIDKNKAIPILGNSVDEIFWYQKYGTLVQANVYTRPDTGHFYKGGDLVVKDVQLEEIPPLNEDSIHRVSDSLYQELKKNLEQDPFNENNLNALIENCRRNGNYEKCELYFTNLIKQFPDSVRAYLIAARYSHRRVSLEDSSALPLLLQAVKVDSNHYEVNYLLARSFYDLFHAKPTAYHAFWARKYLMRSADIDITQRPFFKYPVIQLSTYLKDSGVINRYAAYTYRKADRDGATASDSRNWYFPFEILLDARVIHMNDYRLHMMQEVSRAIRHHDWFSEDLVTFKERVLQRQGNEKVYRFLWIRSFNVPILIRMENIHHEIILSVKVARYNDSLRGYTSFEETTKHLKTRQWDTFKRMLAGIDFWSMVSQDYHEQATDGALWLLEASDDAHYQVVERQGHVYPQYTNCLKYLLSLADLHLAKDEIY